MESVFSLTTRPLSCGRLCTTSAIPCQCASFRPLSRHPIMPHQTLNESVWVREAGTSLCSQVPANAASFSPTLTKESWGEPAGSAAHSVGLHAYQMLTHSWVMGLASEKERLAGRDAAKLHPALPGHQMATNQVGADQAHKDQEMISGQSIHIESVSYLRTYDSVLAKYLQVKCL